MTNCCRKGEKDCFLDLDSTWNYFLIKVSVRRLGLEKALVFLAYWFDRNSCK